ncbi:hypothetical protein RHODGE_RHODGE_02863 [Rhodoplanes serenus]|uniref:Uncharacterized protein n=1 Tax=Rhodoplanes serenus TaxID=200615 RepID=A0A447CWH0_9BRAD|nr:hypothetical protein [Rhodoplanes serenus]MBI5111334.1 hypothetical protein [Rhodovulum sp.]VCU09694.1 hypothetical protein RHODGE_RHODGE_02863 [Rhodoplanes serenus]
MSTTTHTPGPWTVEDPLGPESLWIVEAGKEPHEWRCIAMVCRDDLDDHDDFDVPIGAGEQQANARLIAAAPETAAERDRLRELNAELVAALKRARYELVVLDECSSITIEEIDRVIAKAEGR